jgi:predicted negative regulator of RcsB-dependent stress response
LTRHLLWVAEVQAQDGAIGDALDTTEEALRAVPENFSVRPEIYRVRGELWVQRGDKKLAESNFNQAIELATCDEREGMGIAGQDQLGQADA